jgi:hypothetical protein
MASTATVGRIAGRLSQRGTIAASTTDTGENFKMVCETGFVR